LPSDKTLGKIGFVNIQIKPWREVKMLNYMVGFMKKLVGYNPEEICHILKPKYLCENKFSAKLFYP
jgi:hypothetical protein